jgi:hypothetical protein
MSILEFLRFKTNPASHIPPQGCVDIFHDRATNQMKAKNSNGATVMFGSSVTPESMASYVADQIAALPASEAVFDGEPVSYSAVVAAVKATGTSDTGTVTWQVKVAGTAGNDKVLNILDAGADSQPLSFALDGANIVNVTSATNGGAKSAAAPSDGITWRNKTAGVAGDAFSLVVLDPGADSASPLSWEMNVDGVTIEVTPVTDAGAAATATMAEGTVVTAANTGTTLGALGNAWNVVTALSNKANPITGGATIINPSQAASVQVVGTDIQLSLGTTAGVCGGLLISEDSGVGIGQIELNTNLAHAGAWSDNVRMRILLPQEISQTAAVTITNPDGGFLSVEVSLGTNSSGDVIPLSDDALKVLIDAQLVANSLDTVFDCVSGSAGNFDSPENWVPCVGGVDPIADGTANAFATVEALLAGLDEVATATGASGAISTVETVDFIGGGVGYAATSTGAQIAALGSFPLEISAGSGTPAIGTDLAFTGGGVGYAATSTATQIVAQTAFPLAVTVGGSVVPAWGNDVAAFSGGAAAIGEIIGTPAVNLGRRAIGFAGSDEAVKSEWSAHYADPGGTNASTWVKTFTGS